jgi:hypothetical protein
MAQAIHAMQEAIQALRASSAAHDRVAQAHDEAIGAALAANQSAVAVLRAFEDGA